MSKTILTSLLAVALLAPACAVAQSRSSAPEFNPHGLDYSNVTMDLADYDEPFKRDGRRVPADQILSVVPGVKAERVRELLGQPLSAGQGERGPEWDYNLKLDIADEDFIVCQYKVVFEADNDTVRETSWRRYQCKLAAVAAPSPVPQHFDLSGDFLFDFDQDVLTARGMEVLDQLARQLSGTRSRVDIVGHTDRLGSVAYNQDLSERRARTVADYLVSRGIERERLGTSGRGEAEQVKQCEGERPTPELRACLHPNRRVAISITPAD
ncbi:OmpA family protein [Luteimonas sp. SDU82]|uniref:OmpA family protein n=1 Tax=Luteimonas sp. SDU82 TaxID=3422592 RepID=UPI003EBED054